MNKKQVCILLDMNLYKKLKKISEETGLPLSKVIELRLKGFEIVRARKEKRDRLSIGEIREIMEIKKESLLDKLPAEESMRNKDRERVKWLYSTRA